MRVLIAVDDSPCSQSAMTWVKQMKWPATTQFLVLSVARMPVATYAFADAGGTTAYSGDLLEEQIRHHQEIAARFERQLRDSGFGTEAMVAQGDPREEILATAKDRGVDLIVLGSHGRSGITKLMLGSVATHVVTHAPCAVAVIKAPYVC